ncbi:hypothetical protein ACFCWT_13510 [Streptomyces olivaceus]|uniref:hypothetical protein n=1 Tax=Streptomyces olivaceus TaxID=47716 RepID=UPI0035D8C72A
MALRVEVPLSAINTEVELPITIGLGGEIITAGTLYLDVRNGQVEDFRKPYADALREIADAMEQSTGTDDGEVPDAAARG